MDHRDDWYENDRFWELMRPYMFPDERWERATEEVDALVERLDLKPGDDVLDVPCGPGRHALELADRGMELTAVDRTRLFVEEVEELAEQQGLDIEVQMEDMRQFRRPGFYDAILNLFTSFGYFEDQEDDRRVLELFFENLRPGGAVVLEMAGKEGLARNYCARDWNEFDDGAILLEHRELSQDWSWITNRWILLTPDEQRHEFRLGHRLYSGAELRRLVERAGFVDVEVTGSLDGKEDYPPDSFRLVVVGRKPD